MRKFTFYDSYSKRVGNFDFYVSRCFVNDVYDYENNQTLERRINGLHSDYNNVRASICHVLDYGVFMVESIFMGLLLGVVIATIIEGVVYERF